jgi:hypothetical protein
MPTVRKPIVLAALVASLVGVAGAHARARPGPLPYMGPQPAPSLFGIDTSLYDSNHGYFVRDVPTARRMGSRWDRLTVGPLTGTGDFSPLDWEVEQARRYGLGVILSLGGIARACSLHPLPSNVHACPPTTASALRTYQQYVRRVVLRYRNVVSYYESWVEPNHRTSWLPGPSAAAYAALLKAEYAVFQSVNARYHTHLKLLFGSMIGFSITPRTRGWIAVLPFTHRVLDGLAGLRPFDAVALHAYRFPPATNGPSDRACDYVGGLPIALGASTYNCPSPDWRLLTWPEELSAYEQLFSAHGYGQPPLWLTEFGWPGNAQAGDSYYPSDAVQAKYVEQAYADLLKLPFVQGALWFNLRDYQPALVTPDPGFFYHYGLLGYGFALKPAATVFKTLAAANPGR